MVSKGHLPHRFAILTLAALSTVTTAITTTNAFGDQYGGYGGPWDTNYNNSDMGSSNPSSYSCSGSNGSSSSDSSWYPPASSSGDSSSYNPSSSYNDSTTYGSGSSYGFGFGNSYDSGSSYGFGFGNSYDSGSSYGFGFGNSYDSGSSYGFGFGDSYDSGSSYGFGFGDSGMGNFGGGDSGGSGFAGDPINVLVGNMVESATDYRGGGPFALHFTRTYNSLPFTVPGYVNSLGAGWRGTYDSNVVTYQGYVYVYRPDGNSAQFSLVNGVYQSASDIVSTLQPILANGQQNGWTYTTATGTVETYDVNGRLLSITNRNGLSQVLAYDGNGNLSSVTDPARRSLQFIYDGTNRLTTLIGPDGAKVQYQYDGNNNLTSIIYPDGTTRGYLYENSTFPSLLTGKIDAKGVTVGSWTYDGQGRAIGNQLANGVAAVTVTYNANSTDVTDARGVTRTRNFQRIGSDNKILSMTVTCGDCEPNLARNITYDANGFVSGITDFSGRMVQYTRNASGLVLTKTEAAGTPLARTTTYT